MDKKHYLKQTFDQVSEGYDQPALSFFPQTAKLMVDYMTLKEGAHILDVCTGTGVVALEAASSIKNCKVIGIDLSQGMLNKAQQKADKLALNNIDFRVMDLDALSFPDDYFEAATSSFGIFFLDDMTKALQNIHAKVKTGGQIAISVFSAGAFEPMSLLFLDRIEAMGHSVPPQSWKNISQDHQLKQLFSQAGMTQLIIHREPLGFYMKDAEDWWNIVWNAGYRGLLNQLSATELATFKAEHMAEVNALCKKGDNWLDTGVIIAIGQA